MAKIMTPLDVRCKPRRGELNSVATFFIIIIKNTEYAAKKIK